MTDNVLKIRSAAETRWDCASFGEVMLRFDPGFGRVRNARSFQVWEGGGEYNVARAMRKCWGKRATAVTALPQNDLGWLVEDLMMQGGVDTSKIIWREFDGLGRNTRVGLNFTEKGFGIRAALGASPSVAARSIIRLTVAVWGAGMLIGLLAAVIVPRLFTSRLWDQDPTDPAAIGVAAAAITLTVAAASWRTLRRALHLLPAAALRDEPSSPRR